MNLKFFLSLLIVTFIVVIMGDSSNAQSWKKVTPSYTITSDTVVFSNPGTASIPYEKFILWVQDSTGSYTDSLYLEQKHPTLANTWTPIGLINMKTGSVEACLVPGNGNTIMYTTKEEFIPLLDLRVRKVNYPGMVGKTKLYGMWIKERP